MSIPSRAIPLCLLIACLPLGACQRPVSGQFNRGPLSSPANRQEVDRRTLEIANTPRDDTRASTANKAVVESELVQVPTLSREKSAATPAEYVIGPRDELMIAVAPHENAGLASGDGGPGSTGGAANQYSSLGTSNRTGKTVVHDDGNIQVQGIGNFKAQGLTITELSDALRKEYVKIGIKEPEVIIEIQAYKSQMVYLSGQFGKPGPMALERQTDMLQLISMAGNPNANANIRGAYVQRKDKDGKYKMLPLDLYSLLEEGDLSQNIWVHPGDFIYIPDNSKQMVYMLGNIGKVGPLALHKDGSLNLAQAVVEAGGLRSFGNDWHSIRIIRSHSATHGEFIVVDYQKIVDGEAMPFQLQAGDVVYFPSSRLGDWNEALGAIGPSLNIVGQAMTPFVQMKVLQQTFK